MFVSLLVHGVERAEFFQVVVAESETVRGAKAAVTSYLARQGKRVINFDDEETLSIPLEMLRLPRVEPNPEAVVAASGCIWVNDERPG